MGNRLPEWLRPRCPWGVAQALGRSTSEARMTVRQRARIGRLGGRAVNKLKSPEQITADCQRARDGRQLKLWRAGGFVLTKVPMIYNQYLMLRAVAGQPGRCCRQLARAHGQSVRSAWRACCELAAGGLIVVEDRGPRRRHPMTITEAGSAQLEHVRVLVGDVDG